MDPRQTNEGDEEELGTPVVSTIFPGPSHVGFGGFPCGPNRGVVWIRQRNERSKNSEGGDTWVLDGLDSMHQRYMAEGSQCSSYYVCGEPKQIRSQLLEHTEHTLIGIMAENMC